MRLLEIIAEQEARQLIVQCGGQIWACETILSCNTLECGPARKLRVGPLCVRVYNLHTHHVISVLSFVAAVQNG